MHTFPTNSSLRKFFTVIYFYRSINQLYGITRKVSENQRAIQVHFKTFIQRRMTCDMEATF